MEKRKKILFGVVLPVLVLAGAVAVMKGLVAMRKPPARKESANRGILVSTLTAVPEDRRVVIHATGSVEPSARVAVTPQVSGRVVWVAPGLKKGGFFAAGEEMFTVEDIDYRLAVDKAESLVAKRKVELASVESKAEVARREWKRLGRGKPPTSSLVLYGPQLKEARANLAGAEADRKMAQLNLDRTTVRAPFACVVVSEEIDPGQYLRAGNPAATVVASDAAEVVIPVSLADFDWLTMPGKDRRGSAVRVNLPGRSDQLWQGEVVRILADVDPRDRMLRLVARVDDPFRRGGAGSRIPLPMGQFVEVALDGKELTGVVVIPLSALHDGDLVWFYEEGELAIRKVGVARRERNEVFVSSGIAAGDRVVLTNITGAAPGMKLRLAEAR